MKKTVKMVPIVVLSIILLLGCGNSSKRNDAFVGKWRANTSYADITFDFKKNGTVEFYNSGETMSAKWETGEIV